MSSSSLETALSSSRPLTKFDVFHRVTLSLLGSYAFTWGLTALGMAALVAMGIDFHEAETAMLIVAFLVILPVFLWAFSVRSITTVWVVLGGGASFMLAAAWLIQTLVLA